MEMTGAQILIEALISQGVDTMFGYPGGTVINIYDALYDRRDAIRHILTCHEQGAAHAADGYARATGKTGVVLATSGPGAANLVTGIATAYQDSVPMVAITGNVTADLIGRDSFQELDIVDVTNPITKHNYFVQRVEDIPAVIRQAFEIACSGRKGPVLVDIPKDITAAKCHYTPQPMHTPRPIPSPDGESLHKAALMVAESQRPLIYCGGGVTFGGSGDMLLAFAKKIGAPICVSMMGLSAIDSAEDSYLGLVGMHGTVTSNMAVSQCDLLIAVGARFSDRVTGNRFRFASGAKVLHIDIDRSEISKNIQSHHSLVGDAGECLQKLTAMARGRQGSPWMDMILAHKRQHALPPPASPNGEVKPRALIDTIRKAVGGDAIIATDVGQHQMITAQHYPFCRPRSFISSCGLGTMGYGMGAANGAAVGCPGRPVVLVTGDGSFHMDMMELAVAVTEQLPITVVIMNNRVLGMVHQWQRLFYDKRYSFTEVTRKTDFAAAAQALGARGYRIESQEQMLPVLQEAVAGQGPSVIDCRIAAHECVFPIIPPGAGVEEMITEESCQALDEGLK